MSTEALLDAIAPGFAGEPSATKQVFIDLAAQRLSATAWGTLYQQGVVYLAAHLMTVRDNAGNGLAGAVTSVKTGGLSVGSSGAMSDHELATTSFGQEFLSLQRRIATSPYIRSTC